MEIREIDPADAETLHSWWELGRRATAARGWPQWPDWEISRTALPRDNPERTKRFFAAYDDDLIAGTLMYLTPRNDNPHLAFVEVWVPPELRRRGIGTTLLEYAEGLVRADGRDTVLIEAWSVPDGEAPGRPFLEANGFRVVNEEAVKTTVVDHIAWSELEAEVAAHLGPYRIETWGIVTPDPLVEGMCRLLSSFNAEIPLGEMDLQDSEWTPERLRTIERHFLDDGRRLITAGAVAPDGSLVGFSDVRWMSEDPRLASVGLTIVDPGHRGHRLGLALKLATHRGLRDDPTAPRLVITGNADVNTHMNAINVRLGYRVVEKSDEMQKKL